MKSIWSFFLLLISTAAFAVETDSLTTYEDSLEVLFTEMRSANTDAEKKSKNNKFVALLKTTLERSSAFTYPFEKLQIGKITSPDGVFRMYNWNVQWENGEHQYYCLIQHLNIEKNTQKIFELNDYTKRIPKVEAKNLTHKKWLGALYYLIIPVKKDNSTYYVLLGVDLNNTYSRKKLIESMQFTSTEVKFGLPVFRGHKGTKRRVIFECAPDNVMSLKYEEKQRSIVFDHLSPMDARLKGQYAFYVNDLTYSAYILDKKKGLWSYAEDIDAKIKKGDMDDSHYTTPEGDPFKKE